MIPNRVRTGIAAAASLAALTTAPSNPTHASGSPRSLGGGPLCEASAILHVPCAQAARGCWLVGDNEVRSELFLFPVREDESPDVSGRRAVAIDHLLAPKRELSDIEALARLQDGETLVYASHSRNKRCETKKKRRGYLGLRLPSSGDEGAQAGRIGFVRSKAKDDWERVFPVTARGTLGQLADAVRQGERAARNGDCTQTVDIEAAVTVPGEGGDAVWMGLRSPLLGEDAVLVRHDLSAGRLRWVEARRVRTGGRGIRGLAHSSGPEGGWIYGLSPQPGTRTRDESPEDRAFDLWRFPVQRLADPGDSGPIEIERLQPVAPRSEGVAIRRTAHGAVAVVVQDGEEGETPDRCDIDATYQVIPLALLLGEIP